MPVADYTKYCEMLDRARSGQVCLRQSTSRRSRPASRPERTGRERQRRDHPGVDRRRAFASGTAVKDMATRRVRLPNTSIAPPSATRSTSRSIPTIARRLAGHVCPAAGRRNGAAPGARAAEPFRRPHVRRKHSLPLGENLALAVETARTLSQNDLSPRDREPARSGEKRMASRSTQKAKLYVDARRIPSKWRAGLTRSWGPLPLAATFGNVHGLP